LESSAANRPHRPLFCRLLAPWNNHAAANPAKNGLGGADFRYRRPKSDRLLGLTLREEFLENRLKGTAIELYNDTNTGATQITAKTFLEITYPTHDLQKGIADQLSSDDLWSFVERLANGRSAKGTGLTQEDCGPFATRGTPDQQPARRSPSGCRTLEVEEPRGLSNTDTRWPFAAGGAVAVYSNFKELRLIMTPIPKHLNKEPLIEAIWQIQFEPKEGLPVGDLLPGILYSTLKADYPTLQLHRLPTADIPAPVAQFDPNLRLAAKYRMEEPGSPFLFQVGDRVVTMNCRKPYAGWPTFKEKILKLLDVVENSGLVPTPLRHSLRYIDLLMLAPAPSLKALQAKFQIGRWNLENSPLQMRVEVADDECNHIIQIATPAEANLPAGRFEGSVIDLETFSNSILDGWQDVRAQIDQLHDRSKAVFYQQLLTAEAIELMDPEY
jgi:uncharacterized protein (TIGR04255 family)